MAVAVENGYEGIARILLKNGANINQPMNISGWAPIHVAADSEHEKIVDLLIKNGADIGQLTPEHLTALDLAREKGLCIVLHMIYMYYIYFTSIVFRLRS